MNRRSNYKKQYENEDTYQKYHKKWMKEQNAMRPRLQVKDLFSWDVPDVELQYEQNSDYGIAIVKQNVRPQSSQNDDDYKSSSTEQLRYIGGVDISFTKPWHYQRNVASAGLMICEYPSMKLVHQETAMVTMEHPYIAGFLAFREVDHLIKLFKNIVKTKPQFTPQLIMVDGNGILHYRRMGLATHLAMEIGIPTIGIAKRLLKVDKMNVEYLVPMLNNRLSKIGEFFKLKGFNDEQIGYAVRTTYRDEVVFVSPGHMIGLESSLKLVMACLDAQKRWKLPEPVEKADILTRDIIRQYERDNPNPPDYVPEPRSNNVKRNYPRNNRNSYNNNNNNNNSKYGYNNNTRGGYNNRGRGRGRGRPRGGYRRQYNDQSTQSGMDQPRRTFRSNNNNKNNNNNKSSQTENGMDKPRRSYKKKPNQPANLDVNATRNNRNERRRQRDKVENGSSY